MIKISNLHKSFGTLEVLQGIDLEIAEREVVVIIGPSGSGKSTLLRCINYLEEPTSGTITVDGQELETRDGLGITDFETLDIKASTDAKFLLMEIPVEQ